MKNIFSKAVKATNVGMSLASFDNQKIERRIKTEEVEVDKNQSSSQFSFNFFEETLSDLSGCYEFSFFA
jgi:hypothetical protein